MQQVQSDTDDADGNLIGKTDAAGDTTAYTYNPLDEPAQQEATDDTPPELGPAFDKDGLMASDTDLQSGAVTEYFYNMLGQQYQNDPAQCRQRRHGRRAGHAGSL